MAHSPAFVATIALCGGTSRRMNVPDKTALPFGAGTILDSALTGLPPGLVVCVGEPRPVHTRDDGARQLIWTRETPTGGGPVAGIRAGLEAVLTQLTQCTEFTAPTQLMGPAETPEPTTSTTAHDRPFPPHLAEHRDPLVAVIAGDQPFAGRIVPYLADELGEQLLHGSPLDGIPDGMAVASPGRDEPALLLAVYRLRALDSVIPRDSDDLGVYRTLTGLKIEVTAPELPIDELLTIDVDDPDDLARATAILERLQGQGL